MDAAKSDSLTTAAAVTKPHCLAVGAIRRLMALHMLFDQSRWYRPHLLGIQLTFNGLYIDPCIPKDWKGFEITRKWREAEYIIKVNNPSKKQKGVKQIKLNGKETSNPIPIQKAESKNKIEVLLG